MQPETATVASPAQQSFPWIATRKGEQPAAPAKQAAQAPASQPASHSAPPHAPTLAHAAPSKGFVVQAGAFSSRKNATAVADAIHGSISHSGSLYRVRTGPFTSRKEAEASLAKVHGAGYSDARIFWSG
jgi:rare lipoprotein A